MNDKAVISILAALLETCVSAQNTFRHAAQKIQNTEFRRIFTIFLHQRTEFARELRAEVDRLQGSPAGDGEAYPVPNQAEPLPGLMASWPGACDEASIVSECEQGEARAVIQYQEALKMDLPPEVQYVLRRQYMDIKDAYDRIRILQRAA